MTTISNNIINQISSHGLRAKLISIKHIEKIKQELEEVQNNNPFIGKYLSGYFEEFNYEPSNIMTNPKSLLIVAVPDSIARIYFNLNGRKHTVLMPPMYLFNSSVKNENNQKKIMEINILLEKILSPYSLEVHKINLPAKLLAVRSGLGVYGKNNICYVEGLGSFMWLGVYLTDIPCDKEVWLEYNNMDICKKCDLCLHNCPTNAINSDSFIIQVSRCITYHNESEKTFPSWIGKNKNNAIIGCLRCQIVCPANREHTKNIVDIATFEDYETVEFLKETALDNLKESTIKKLEDINFIEYYNLFVRNLKLLIER